MPLHPQVEDMLERLAALGLPALEESTPDEARQGMRLRTLGLGTPEPVDRVEDLRVPVSGGEIRVRSYAMESSSETALVYFHGGGWVIGDVGTHDDPSYDKAGPRHREGNNMRKKERQRQQTQHTKS